ncbi:MAG: protein kinase [Candidatus Riflebacteria bacterium]|nr:protein kinase [Candidatus Riflebacteria bacterium]
MTEYCNKRAGNYTIIKKLGDGGFATVYLGQHTVLEKKAAIKFLLEDWIEESDVVSRFFDEARTMERLHDHPNIVKIIDIATVEKCKEEGLPPYFIMEYINGPSLEDLIKSNQGFSIEDIVKVMVCALSALQYCHDQGVVHRDIKPSNFMINSAGDVKLTDFGIAKARKNTSKTGEGLTLGSTDYMSPEQALGKRDLDYRSDIYSLGVTLYQMVCDRLPFLGNNPNEIALKHIQEKPVPPIEINDAVPQKLNNIILKAIEKEREHRYQSCDEMAQALIKLNEPEDPQDSLIGNFDLSEFPLEDHEDGFGGEFDRSSPSHSTTKKFAVRPPTELINTLRTILIVAGFTVLFLMLFKAYYHFTQAHFVLHTTPPGATVIINKNSVGSSPLDISLPPMGYLITFSMPEHATETVYFDVVARQNLVINRKLLELSPSDLPGFVSSIESLYKKIGRLPDEPPKTKREMSDYEHSLAIVNSEWEKLFTQLSENSNYEQFNNYFIEFCEKTGNLDRADRYYEKLIKTQPSSMIYTFAGLVKKLKKDDKQALKLYMEAWTADPNNHCLLNKLGDYFIDDQKPERARQYFEMSLFLYPDQDEIHKKLDLLK